LAHERRKIRGIHVAADHCEVLEQNVDSEAVIQSGTGIQINPNKGGTFRTSDSL
jgi:hypothetical protein